MSDSIRIKEQVRGMFDRHGERGSHNGHSTIFHVEEDNLTFDNKTKYIEYSGIRFMELFMLEDINYSDVINVRGQDYFVFKRDAVWHKGERVYTEVIIYENDFNHNLQFFKHSQDGEIGIQNKPTIKGESYLSIEGRVKTAYGRGRLEFSFNSDEQITHYITVRTVGLDISLADISKIEVRDLIRTDNKDYEIINIENINENNRLIFLSCVQRIIEVENVD